MRRHYLIITLMIVQSGIGFNVMAADWIEGIVLPEMQAIVKTSAQLMEQVPADKRSTQPIVIKPENGTITTLEKVATNSSSPLDPTKLFPNFTVATYEDSGVVPPDAMGVAGPEQFILAANGLVRSFDKKTGKPDNVLNISTTLFFSPIAEGSFTSDSRIRYDRFSDRWFLVINATAPLRTGIAISDSGVITAATKWSFFFIQPRTDSMADYPTIGIDKQALYIGVNLMSKTTGYVNSDVFVIPKEPLLKGTLKAYGFQNLITAPNFEGPMSPQGVDNYDPDATEGYFIGLDGSSNNLVIRRVRDPGTRPAISGNINVAIPRATLPLDVPQKGSIASDKFFLQGFDKRLSSAHIREKQLYVAHNVGVNNEGSYVTDAPTRDGCLWYEINLSDPAKPTLTQTGILYQPSATNDKEQRFYWMPGVMTNGLNSLAVACSTSGDSELANAAFALRYSNEPKGLLRKPQLYTNSSVVYTLGFPPYKLLRWGEYSHVSVDPTDNMTFWCIAEYTYSFNSWGLQAVRVPAAPPAKVTKVTPSTVKGNQNNLHISIAGERVEGSAFYDPGEGYQNRLKVEIEGVAINAIKWISLTQIDLVISTGEALTPQPKSIKITNPDGQVAIAEGLLVINSNDEKVVIER